MTISAILAMSQNRVIGEGSRLPWNLPEDMRFFREKTKGHPVIMGRKTWDSMGKALPGRTNIVVSRQRDLTLTGAITVPTLEAALDQARASPGSDIVFFIGGAGLMKAALPLIETFYLTVIHRDYEGDVRLPPFEDQFREVHRVDRPGPPPFSFLTYVRN